MNEADTRLGEVTYDNQQLRESLMHANLSVDALTNSNAELFESLKRDRESKDRLIWGLMTEVKEKSDENINLRAQDILQFKEENYLKLENELNSVLLKNTEENHKWQEIARKIVNERVTGSISMAKDFLASYSKDLSELVSLNTSLTLQAKEIKMSSVNNGRVKEAGEVLYANASKLNLTAKWPTSSSE